MNGMNAQRSDLIAADRQFFGANCIGRPCAMPGCKATCDHPYSEFCESCDAAEFNPYADTTPSARDCDAERWCCD